MNNVLDRIYVDAPERAATRPSLRRAALRMALLMVAAVGMYGTWAFFANLAHGASVALRAGLAQGASSGFTTLVIGSVVEALHAALPRGRRRTLVAVGISASLSSLVHLGVHLAAGTPEILRAILPSVIMGYVFAASYAFALEGPRVRVTYRRPATLTPAERDAIWSLLTRSVQRDRRAFEDKLARIDEVFLGHLPTNELVVFGAVDVVEVDHERRTDALIYTHWAVIDPRFRGSNVIQHVGLRFLLRYRARHPLRAVYWMFTASTFHSYLLLVNNFATYWPRPGVAWPSRERTLVSAAMRLRSEPSWDEEAGVLRRKGASRYREGVVDDEPALLHHPVIGAALRFYRAENPGQPEGDSLVCLCPLSAANAWSCARAVAGRIGRRKHHHTRVGGHQPDGGHAA
jgi:hypothetical protein